MCCAFYHVLRGGDRGYWWRCRLRSQHSVHCPGEKYHWGKASFHIVPQPSPNDPFYFISTSPQLLRVSRSSTTLLFPLCSNPFYTSTAFLDPPALIVPTRDRRSKGDFGGLWAADQTDLWRRTCILFSALSCFHSSWSQLSLQTMNV